MVHQQYVVARQKLIHVCIIITRQESRCIASDVWCSVFQWRNIDTHWRDFFIHVLVVQIFTHNCTLLANHKHMCDLLIYKLFECIR